MIAKKMKVEHIVIGGGVAGAYISETLNREKKDFLLLEASEKLGGRHLTVKDKSDKVMYEAGAWRVHSSHTRMIQLCERLQLTLVPFEKQHSGEKYDGIDGLTKFDSLILKNDGNIEQALHDELKTGYQGTYDTPSNSHPYSVNTKSGEYFIIKEGQQEIVDRLVINIPEEKIKLAHSVQNIKKEKDGYRLTIAKRTDRGPVEYMEIETKFLFCCIAQYDAWKWEVSQKYLKPLLNSVKPLSLNHIYATSKDVGIVQRANIPASALAQVIPSTHDRKWFQVSYSAGRVANFWYNYKLRYGKSGLKKLVEKYFLDQKLDKVESYYWTHAYHLWRVTPYFEIEKVVKNSICPNPVKLPNLWWAGECFSSYQGWSEGALETAEMALEMRHDYLPFYKKIDIPVKEWMLFDGRILDVKRWKNVHPGSKGAIVGHLGEDISDLFRFIKHSELSWATLFSLQIGSLL
jgi:hypothetical protein